MRLGSTLSFAFIIFGSNWPCSVQFIHAAEVHDIEELPEDHCTLMQVHHDVKARARKAFEACDEVVPVKGSLRPMPAILSGTFRQPLVDEELIDATKLFLKNGGRGLDTAIRYRNHEDLAVAIRESGVPREEIWITDKIQPAKVNTSSDVVKAVSDSLKELEVDYIDLMLLHWPDPPDGGPNVELWRGLLEAKKAGYILNAGVANYNITQLEELEQVTGEAPAVNQIEFHPFAPSSTREIFEWCQERGIAVMAYDLLGGPSAAGNVQSDAVDALAEKYMVTDVQLLIRWALDKGVAPIIKASSEEHILEDLNCSGLKHLSASDIQFLESAEKPSNWFEYRHPFYGHDYD